MSAIDLANIDSNVLVYNEWNVSSDLLYEIVNIDSTENMVNFERMPLKLPEVLDTLRLLYLLAPNK